MYKIVDNKIYLTRGDTMVFDINIFDEDGNPYKLKDGDKVEFTVKPVGAIDNNPYTMGGVVIQKTGPEIKITNDDTQHLPFGAYVYDVQITFASGDRDTIIAPAEDHCGEAMPNFFLTWEVNFG